MSTKILNFSEMIIPSDMLFDKVTVTIKFSNNSSLQICQTMATQFEYFHRNNLHKFSINKIVHIPSTAYDCRIYVHATIVNMKTLPQILQINLSDKDDRWDCSEKNGQFMAQTQLGPFFITILQQQQNYIPYQIDSQLSDSTLTVYDIKDYRPDSIKEQKVIKKKQSATESDLQSSQQYLQKQQYIKQNQKNPKNIAQLFRYRRSFLSDQNINNKNCI